MSIQVEIVNRQRALRADRRRLASVARSVLAAEGVSAATVEVAVVGDAEMARLNWQFLRHRGPTDVLSFDLSDTPLPLGEGAGVRASANPSPSKGEGRVRATNNPSPLTGEGRVRVKAPCTPLPLGEGGPLGPGEGETPGGKKGACLFQIIVSADTARRQAKRIGHPIISELALYLVHGLLHQLGHDDQTAPSRKRMAKRQAELLRKAGFRLGG